MDRLKLAINGRTLYVELHGPPGGAPVILLHHGLGAVQSWKDQLPALAQAGLRAIAYDRWGYGRSDPRPHLDIPAFADDQADLLGLMEALALPQAALLGHSDGGTLALYFAARRPERVSRLVAVAAHVYVEPKMKMGILGVQQVFAGDPRLQAGLRRLHGDKTEAVFSHWFHGWIRRENLDWDICPLLCRVSCPVLVAQGEEDEHALPQHARDIAAALPAADLWLEPGAGHMLPQDFPEKFNRKVLEFLLPGVTG